MAKKDKIEVSAVPNFALRQFAKIQLEYKEVMERMTSQNTDILNEMDVLRYKQTESTGAIKDLVKVISGMNDKINTPVKMDSYKNGMFQSDQFEGLLIENMEKVIQYYMDNNKNTFYELLKKAENRQ